LIDRPATTRRSVVAGGIDGPAGLGVGPIGWPIDTCALCRSLWPWSRRPARALCHAGRAAEQQKVGAMGLGRGRSTIDAMPVAPTFGV
jgi:hypothetical protein